MRVMGEVRAPGSVKVVVSAALSSRFEKRYVVVDAATGDIVDDAQGYGYKTAQNAHRAHAYKSAPLQKKRQRDAVKGRVRTWCTRHTELMEHAEQAMVYAMKEGETLTEADVSAIVNDHGVALPFTVNELMRHW